MIKYFCNWCLKDTTKKYTDVHLVTNYDGREIARVYHVCPRCSKEMFKLIRKDDMRN